MTTDNDYGFEVVRDEAGHAVLTDGLPTAVIRDEKGRDLTDPETGRARFFERYEKKLAEPGKAAAEGFAKTKAMADAFAKIKEMGKPGQK